MPRREQPEADRLPAQAASAARLDRHFSTYQVTEFKSKTQKLGSFRQICADPNPGIGPTPHRPIFHRISTVQIFVSIIKTAKLVSFRQIAGEMGPAAPALAAPRPPKLASFRHIPARREPPRPLPGKAQISTAQTAEFNPQTQKMVSFRPNAIKPQPVRELLLSRTLGSPVILPRVGESLVDLVYTVARSGGETPLAEIRS